MKIFYFVLALIVLNACSLVSQEEFNQASDESLIEQAREKVKGGEKKSGLNYGVGTVGISNFRNIYEGYRAATGVTGDLNLGQNVTANSLFASKVAILAVNNNAELMGPAHTNAVASVAGAFCVELVRRNRVPGIALGTAPGSVTPQQREAAAIFLHQMFLTRDPSDLEKDILLDLWAESLALNTPGQNNQVQNENALVSVCTAVAASPESIWRL